jgi:hypothetical protein
MSNYAERLQFLTHHVLFGFKESYKSEVFDISLTNLFQCNRTHLKQSSDPSVAFNEYFIFLAILKECQGRITVSPDLR